MKLKSEQKDNLDKQYLDADGKASKLLKRCNVYIYYTTTNN